MRSGHSGRISRRISNALLRFDFPGTLSIPSGLSITMILSFSKSIGNEVRSSGSSSGFASTSRPCNIQSRIGLQRLWQAGRKEKDSPSPALRASSPQGARVKLVFPITFSANEGNFLLAPWGSRRLSISEYVSEDVRRTGEGPMPIYL